MRPRNGLVKQVFLFLLVKPGLQGSDFGSVGGHAALGANDFQLALKGVVLQVNDASGDPRGHVNRLGKTFPH